MMQLGGQESNDKTKNKTIVNQKFTVINIHIIKKLIRFRSVQFVHVFVKQNAHMVAIDILNGYQLNVKILDIQPV